MTKLLFWQTLPNQYSVLIELVHIYHLWQFFKILYIFNLKKHQILVILHVKCPKMAGGGGGHHCLFLINDKRLSIVSFHINKLPLMKTLMAHVFMWNEPLGNIRQKTYLRLRDIFVQRVKIHPENLSNFGTVFTNIFTDKHYIIIQCPSVFFRELYENKHGNTKTAKIRRYL